MTAKRVTWVNREAKTLAVVAAATVVCPVAPILYYGFRLLRWGTVKTLDGIESASQAAQQKSAKRREERKKAAEEQERVETERKRIAALPKPKTKVDNYRELYQGYQDELAAADLMGLPDDEKAEVRKFLKDQFDAKVERLFPV